MNLHGLHLVASMTMKFSTTFHGDRCARIRATNRVVRQTRATRQMDYFRKRESRDTWREREREGERERERERERIKTEGRRFAFARPKSRSRQCHRQAKELNNARGDGLSRWGDAPLGSRYFISGTRLLRAIRLNYFMPSVPSFSRATYVYRKPLLRAYRNGNENDREKERQTDRQRERERERQ